MSQLTPNIISFLCNGGVIGTDKPVVQVMEVKEISGNRPNGPKRFRIIINDGKHYQQCMLATQMNEVILSEKVQQGTIIRIDEALCNVVQGKRILVVLKVAPVGSPVATIGTPVNFETASASDAAPAAGSPMKGVVKPEASAAPQAFKPAAPAKPVSAYSAALTSSAAKTNHANITPISMLTPYNNRWTIKARVTSKAQIRTWNNQRGSGQLFSCDLLDEEGGEIRATFFNAECEKFFPMIQQDSVYFISSAQVKNASKKFNNLNNDYELSIRADTSIELCAEDDDKIAKVKYAFVRIAEMEQLAPNSVCDVLGVVSKVGELGSVTSRTKGTQIPKRDITILDDSGENQSPVEIRVTLWDRVAETFDGSENPVVAIKNVRVSDFNGCSLSASSNSNIDINPTELPEGAQLRFWYDSAGQGQTARAVTQVRGGGAGGDRLMSSDLLTYAQLQAQAATSGTSDIWMRSRASITNINPSSTMWYPACPTEGCNKKVISEDGTNWNCEKCQKTYPNCEYRYILRMGTSDYTSQQYISCFNEVGQQVLGISANELQAMREADPTAFEEHIKKALFKQYNIRIRAANDTYNNEMRLKATALELRPVDFVADSRDLLQQIAASA